MKPEDIIVDQSAEDAICLLNIYHFADLAYPGVRTEEEREALAEIAVKGGLLPEGTEPEDGDAIVDAYVALVEREASARLPDAYVSTYDYWGAKCFAKEYGLRRGMIAAGDSGGRYAAFNSLAAMVGCFDRAAQEIERAKEENE